MLPKPVDRIDNIPEKALLSINLAIGSFVLLAVGGSLAVATADNEEVSGLAITIATLALLVIMSCIAGLISDKKNMKILSVHSVILGIGSILIFYYGLSILLKGFPEGNFSWGLGLFTFLCAYPVYLVRRTLLKEAIGKSIIIKYVHLFIFVIAFCVDITVFWKGITHFESFHQKVIEKHRVK